ncbi:hypothetical protein ACZ90_10370, partial [Streptomyces albus subsp. albus]
MLSFPELFRETGHFLCELPKFEKDFARLDSTVANNDIWSRIRGVVGRGAGGEGPHEEVDEVKG